MESMTGFGRGSSGAVTVELRCVNHRFAEVSCRLGRELAPLEDRIRRQVLSSFGRGRIEVRVEADSPPASVSALHIDKALANAYHDALKELAGALGLPWQPDLMALASLPGVVCLREPPPEHDALSPDVDAALGEAIAQAREMRRAEGRALAADLAARADELGGLVAAMAGIETGAAIRSRLAGRLAEVLAPGAVDPGRLEVEVALLAERAAVDEEIARLGSHLDQFRSAIGETGPVGRKLDFIVQEFHREVNTIGSKAADSRILSAAIEAKGVVEKLREQVQNVE